MKLGKNFFSGVNLNTKAKEAKASFELDVQ
jgi:hypothetical protein